MLKDNTPNIEIDSNKISNLPDEKNQSEMDSKYSTNYTDLKPTEKLKEVQSNLSSSQTYQSDELVNKQLSVYKDKIYINPNYKRHLVQHKE